MKAHICKYHLGSIFSVHGPLEQFGRMMFHTGNGRCAVRPKINKTRWYHSRHTAFAKPIEIMLLLKVVTHILKQWHDLRDQSPS